MENILIVVAVVLVFGLVILIHEAGHLLIAKLAGTEVSDFAIGFGPSLISRSWRGTRYHLCAFPLGGFVRVIGMDPDDPLTKNSYRTKHPLWKLAILAGGSLGNIFLAVVLIFVLSFIGFPRSVVRVTFVVPEGPAAEAGIQPGDVIEEIDGEHVTDSYTLTRRIQDASSQERQTALVVERRGVSRTFRLTPRRFSFMQDGKEVLYNQGRPSLGIINSQIVMMPPRVDLVMPNSKAAAAGIKQGDTIVAVGGESVEFGTDVYYLIDPEGTGSQAPLALTVERNGNRSTATLPEGTTWKSFGVLFHSELERLPFTQTVKRSLKTVYITTVTFVMSLHLLATREGIEMVSGPLGIISIIAQSARTGVYNLIMITMVITLNLGLINLLPIPALDGGHILFLFLGSLGLRISPRVEAMAHRVGLVLLLSLILLITFRDALGLWQLRG